MTLEQRIEKIERTNRRLRLAVLCMVGGFVASLWFGTEPTGMDWQTAVMADDTQKDVPVQQLIRARRIELVNAKGKTVIQLIHKNGRGNVITFNDQGKKLVALSGTVNGDGAMGIFNAKNGKLLIGLASHNERQFGTITTNNASGKRLVIIGAAKSGEGGINTFDLVGKTYALQRRMVK